MGDYMRYLYRCAREYIYDSHPDGVLLWRTVKNETCYILTHPNGWGGMQQEKMNSAMVFAGLIPDTTEGRSSVAFVSEGEACLHYCMNKQVGPSWNGIQVSLISVIV